MDSKRWGILYCPQEGSRKARRRWARVRERLDALDQPYDYVQSEGPGSIERLAAMLVSNGYGTIVVVGGDAALNSALNGICEAVPEAENRPVIGVIPNGLINGFAHFWGLRASNPEGAVEALVHGSVRRVDVGVARVTHFDGTTSDRRFLNCVNIGLAASIVKLRRRYQRFWGGLGLLREVSSALMLLLYRHSAHMQFTIGSETFSRRLTTMCVGSCTGYGQTPSAVPYNGMLDISSVKRPPLLHAVTGLWLLLRGRFLSQSGIRVWRTPRISFSHIGHVTVTIDARPLRHRVTSMDIAVEREALPFLIPKG